MAKANTMAGSPSTTAPRDPATTGDIIKDTTTQTFMRDVIEASREVPVIVDFWAPWCGPCKQLTPVIEKVVRGFKGAVRLVKMNIDDHPQIAGQLGVQSIPAVYRIQGRAADRCVPGRPAGKPGQGVCPAPRRRRRHR